MKKLFKKLWNIYFRCYINLYTKRLHWRSELSIKFSPTIECFICFREPTTEYFGVRMVVVLFLFHYEFSLFPKSGINYDGKELKGIKWDCKII